MKQKRKNKKHRDNFDLLCSLANEAEDQGLTPDEAYMLYGPDVRGLMILNRNIRVFAENLAKYALTADDIRRSLEAFRY